MKKNAIWVTWETQRRNRELAHAFGAILKQFDNSQLPRLRRYFLSMKHTYHALSFRPEVVFAQCPSLLLCLMLAICKYWCRYTLVIDAHNAIMRYLYESGPLVSYVTRYILSRTDYIIVSNDALFPFLPCKESKKLALPDKLPHIESTREFPKSFSREHSNIVCISSFAADEPIYEFVQAAQKITDARFFITGKKAKAAPHVLSYASPEIIFTDYLSEKEFDGYISHADITVDLTLYDNLLVCGAYETLAVGVPGVLSDTQIQRQVFKRGYVFTRCDTDSLESSLRVAIKNKDVLRTEILGFKDEFVEEWNRAFTNCMNVVYSM